MSDDLSESVELPIDGSLDLHPFGHRDLPTPIPDYLELCRQRGILEVRIVHGKGVGVRQRTVHTLLDRLPQLVAHYTLADPARGGWGATVVQLYPLTSAPKKSLLAAGEIYSTYRTQGSVKA